MTTDLTYYAKIEDGIVVAVSVVTWDFLVANPERYGDPTSWIQVFQDGTNRGYCSIGWIYNAITDSFSEPPVEVITLASDGN